MRWYNTLYERVIFFLFIIYGEKPMKKNFVTYSKDEKKIAKIEQILLDKSKEIYFDEKSKFEGISNKVWILYNKNLSEKDSKTDAIEASWLLNDGIINNEAYYLGNTFSLLNDEGFYINPEIHFNILLKERKIFLAYYFGKRFARCIEYGLICYDDEYSIENPKVIWVS